MIVSIHFILSIIFYFWLYVSYFQWPNARVKWLKLLVPEIPVSWLYWYLPEFWAHCNCVYHWGSHVYRKPAFPTWKTEGDTSCPHGLSHLHSGLFCFFRNSPSVWLCTSGASPAHSGVSGPLVSVPQGSKLDRPRELLIKWIMSGQEFMNKENRTGNDNCALTKDWVSNMQIKQKTPTRPYKESLYKDFPSPLSLVFCCNPIWQNTLAL